MHDITDQLERLRTSAHSAVFEAEFAKEVISRGVLQITLSTARDHLLRGLDAIDDAFLTLDRAQQDTTNGDPE